MTTTVTSSRFTLEPMNAASKPVQITASMKPLDMIAQTYT